MGNELSATLPEDWITLDMVNRFTFCPRLFHLMYVEGRWEDNHFTLEGKAIHRRVDRIDQILPETTEEAPASTEGDPPPEIARSVSLAADDLGLMGKLDLVSCDPEGGEAIPVETKRGRVPNVPLRSYPPERAQVMAQAILLRRHGYRCDHGYLYFAGSRTRVRVDFDEELERSTLETIATLCEARAATVMPPPLEDSPKCWGCSLCGICLPDETREINETERGLQSASNNIDSPHGPDPRRLYPARDRATPFYVQEQGARVGKTGERLVVTKEKEILGESRLIETSQLVLFGNVQVSAQTLHLCMEKGIPVIHMSTGAWFHGISHGTGVENAYNRAAQYAAAADPAFCTRLITPLIQAKVTNQRALLLRNGSGMEKERATQTLASHLKSLDTTTSSIDSLLGWEGQAAALYFAAFSSMLKTGELDFDFTTRNRRPPKDPVNALLSFTYALLVKECLVALWGEGLDPWWGLYHRPRHGRPALALDFMEPFRPILADSAVLTCINTGMVKPRDFITNRNGCAMQPAAKKAILRAWEQRLDQLTTHPEFGYRCSYRTILRIQARLLVRLLRGDIPHLPWPVVR